MFIYAIQRAIELGIVDASQYRPVAEKGYAGVITKARIGADGLVDIFDACDGVCVQNNYEDYVNYKRVLNAKEAVGSMLWASTIMECFVFTIWGPITRSKQVTTSLPCQMIGSPGWSSSP